MALTGQANARLLSRLLRTRLGSFLLTVLGVSLVTFALMHAVPGGPFAGLEAAGEFHLPPSIIAQIEESYGLHEPLWRQYLIYMGNLVQGDFGYSLVQQTQVSTLIRQGLGVSLTLGGFAIALAVIIGVPLGVLAAVRKDGWVDHIVTGISILGITIPSFVLSFIFILVLALYAQWLPVAGWGSWAHIVMPTLALTAEPLALVTRYTRMSMVEVLNEPYIELARSSGLPERTVLIAHGLKNALLATVTVVGLAVPALLMGSVLVETIFAVPGMGRFFVLSVTQRDYPAIMGLAVLYAGMVAIANLTVDFTYSRLDPRIRFDRGGA